MDSFDEIAFGQRLREVRIVLYTSKGIITEWKIST